MSDSSPDQPAARRYWPLGQMVLARLREFYRQPEAIFWVYVFPLIMVLALGIAFRNQPIEELKVDVCRGAGAEDVARALEADERFLVEVNGEAMCFARLRTGKTELVVRLRAAAGTASGESPGYQFHFDPTRPGSHVARDAVNDTLQRAAGRRDAAEVTNVEYDEPGGRYIDFLVPGLLGMGLLGGGLWGVGFVIVDLRIRQLLKRFLATPMRKTDFLAGLMISRMLFMIPEVILLLVFSRYVFGVVIHGSIVAVVVLIGLGAVMFSGLGLLVASRAQTLEAVSGLMNVVMLPMWVLSGIFFSSERFPDAVQPLIQALPLTPLIDALRAVMLDGASLFSQGPEIGIMTAWATVSFALALKWFRWM